MTTATRESVSAARKLLSKLTGRIEITDELRREIEAAENALWDALYPANPVTAPTGTHPPARPPLPATGAPLPCFPFFTKHTGPDCPECGSIMIPDGDNLKCVNCGVTRPECNCGDGVTCAACYAADSKRPPLPATGARVFSSCRAGEHTYCAIDGCGCSCHAPPNGGP